MDYIQFIKFVFMTGGQDIKITILVEFCYFVSLVNISLFLSLVAMFFSR